MGTNPSGIVAGFFNGDTRLDLAVSNTAAITASILLANGAGALAQPNFCFSQASRRLVSSSAISTATAKARFGGGERLCESSFSFTQ
ncbi:MAG: hypothetical protein U0Y68_24270 [Blastocatellia bacterium]